MKANTNSVHCILIFCFNFQINQPLTRVCLRKSKRDKPSDLEHTDLISVSIYLE